MNGITNRQLLLGALFLGLLSTLTAAGVFARERFGTGTAPELRERLFAMESRLTDLESATPASALSGTALTGLEGRIDGLGNELDSLASHLRREVAGQRKDLAAIAESLLLLRESEGEQRRLLSGNLESLGRGLEELEGLGLRLRALVDELPTDRRVREAGYSAGEDGG